VERDVGRRRRRGLAAIVGGTVLAAGLGAMTVKWGHSRIPMAALPHPTCGSASIDSPGGDTQVYRADPDALTCFGRATRECRPASILLVKQGVDTAMEYVFTVERTGTTCRVRELSQFYSDNYGGATGPVQTTRCDRATVTGRGVTLACGGQDILIPLTARRS